MLPVIRNEMDPVIVIPDDIAAIVNIGIWRETDQGIRSDRVLLSIQINPGFPLDEQNKVVWYSQLMFYIARLWMMRIVSAVVDVYHKRPPKKAEYVSY